jgi:glycosyltransferase involved in cell wall biosynthesis
MRKSHLAKVLILGKLPPPIGGVRIHVDRLLQHLENQKFPHFEFFHLEARLLVKMLKAIPKSKVIHLHTSNPWLQLLLSIYCLAYRKKLIITYHSNWGRYGLLASLAEQLSACFATIPLVQNPESLVKALKLNRNALLIPAFIPPVKISPLPTTVAEYLFIFKKRFTYIFCTQAWNITFDKHGKETYGISELIRSFVKMKDSGLIISDPSGCYQKYIQQLKIEVPDHVFWISQPHDFVNVLILSDAFIRNTTTDGTCISIYEALLAGKVVFATNMVHRPTGCHVFENIGEVNLEKELIKIVKGDVTPPNIIPDPNVVSRLVVLYNKLREF